MKLNTLSLRTKLILIFMFVIIVGGLLSLSLGSRLVKDTIISQAETKVLHDLGSARMVINEKINEIKDIVSLTAEREGIREDIQNGRHSNLLKKLNRIKEERQLDILTLTDHNGKVITRTRNPEVLGDNQSQDAIIKSALKTNVIASPHIVPRKELLKEGKDLIEQADTELNQTSTAAYWSEKRDSSGILLKAASPIMDENNHLLGILYGGVLLNRNYEIVDRILEIVYKGEQYEGREIGTASIFQQDLQISTNIKNEHNERAIGTRISGEIKDIVLDKGKTWIGRAFVANDWYITAYEPLRNINNQIIGILYVGMLEKPYIDAKNRVMWTFTLMAFLCTTLLLIILYFSTSRIINPLGEMVVATQQIAKGDLFHEVKVKSEDEIGLLADSFNQMTRNLRIANEKLIDWGKTLEKKVEKRTNELTRMQEHLLQSEKLASLGKLSASIAHEINNPLGAILVYSHLLLEDTDKNNPYYENLNKIVRETSRCKDIVKGLLEFARPREPEKHLVDINEVLDKSLSIMVHQTLFQNITFKKIITSPLPKIAADSIQLQQVFMNIILNAAEAMNGTGVLTISTFLTGATKYIEIKFSDTGPGIKDEDKNRLFEPFFSTKDVGKGTGLGLAISYSIIQRHKGTIEVWSEVGKGSTFIIKLPVIKERKYE